MSKTIKYIAFCIVIVLMVGVFAVRVNREDTDPKALPHIDTAVNAADSVNISSLRGHYVLVDFWNSRNAVSRIAATEYDRFMADHKKLNLRLISVNTDTDTKLYKEIVSHDSLNPRTQYHISDTRARNHTPSYQPAEGYASYLLDPQGRIVAYNPTVESLENIVK